MKAGPKSLVIDFPGFLRSEFGDALDRCEAVTSEILDIFAQTGDLTELAAHSPALLEFDWKTYVRLSLTRLVRVEKYLRAHCEPGDSVLDFGALFGNFSLAARRLGLEVDALDQFGLYASSLTPFRTKLEREGVSILDSTADPDVLMRTGRRYKAILLLGVVEHIAHTPKPVLMSLCDRLVDGGHMLVDTPNATYEYQRRRFSAGRSIWPAIQHQFEAKGDFEGHHREYTLDEVTWMLNRIGLVVTHRETFNYSIYGLPALTGTDLAIFRLMEADPSRREYILACGQKRAGALVVGAKQETGPIAAPIGGQIRLAAGRYAVTIEVSATGGPGRLELHDPAAGRAAVELPFVAGRHRVTRTLWLDYASRLIVQWGPAPTVDASARLISLVVELVACAVNRPQISEPECRIPLPKLPGYLLPQIERLVGAATGLGSTIAGLGLRSSTPLEFERLVLLGGGTLAAGSYRIIVEARLTVGRVSFSLLDETTQRWIASAAMEADEDGTEAAFTLAEPAPTRLYVCAHNSDQPGAVEVNVFAVRLEAASPDARLLAVPSQRLGARAADASERPIDGFLQPGMLQEPDARGLVQPVASVLGLRSNRPLRFERMMRLGSGHLAAGTYRLAVEAQLREGRVSFSLLDDGRKVWAASAGLEPLDSSIELLFTLDADTDTSLYVCAHNSGAPAHVDLDVVSATLVALSAGARLIAPGGDEAADDAAAGSGDAGRVVTPIADFLMPEYARLLGRAGLVPGVAAGLSLRSATPLKFERLALLGKGRLEPGRYELRVRAAERAGNVSLSLLEHASDSWLASTPLAMGPTRLRFEVAAGGLVSLYVCASNIPEPAPIDVEIFSVALERLVALEGSKEPPDRRTSGLTLGLAELFEGASSEEGVVFSRPSIEGAYLAIGRTLRVEPGCYLLSARVTCDTGEVAVGVQTGAGAGWLTTLRFSATSERDQVEIVVPSCGSMRVVIAAANATPSALRCWVRELTLVQLPQSG